MKNLWIIILLFFISGCITLQIKSDKELISAPGLIAQLAADYIVVKYPEEVKTFKVLSEAVANASPKDAGRAFDIWLKALSSNIEDPLLQRYANTIMNSFNVSIDNSINYDMGSIRIAKEIARIFNAQLSI